MITLNTPIKFHYPRPNSLLVPEPKWIAHEVKPYQIRDLVKSPLTPEEFRLRPFVPRSRFLIRAKTKAGFRQYYLGNSREFQADSELRLALYEPGRKLPKTILDGPFATATDRSRLRRILRQIEHFEYNGLLLRILVDDFTLVF